MADIVKIYTAEQLYEMFKNKILADAVGLTDFNEGSKIRTLLEGFSETISSIGIDFKEALYTAIPVALYQGFGFPKKTAIKSTGYIRTYRKPAFYVKYNGAGSSALITATATQLSVSVVGAPGDAFTLLYSSYAKTSDLVNAINLLSNWEATLVKDVDSNTVYQYTSIEIIGKINYLYETGFDVMLITDIAKTIYSGYSVTINNLQITTTTNGTIAAGESGVQCLSECVQAGSLGNIAINAIDTMNGKGYVNSIAYGIDGVINDSAFSGGSDAETDTDRKIRFAQTVNALNAGTKNGIIAALLTISGIRSVGLRPAYPFKGANTIVIDTGSGTITPALLESIEEVLYGNPDDMENFPGKNAEGIEYFITVPTIVNVDIGITIYRLPTINVDLDEIKTDVQTAIEQYINTRKLGEDVVLSEIIRVSKNSNAAVYDAVITSPLANISISPNEFSKTGSGTTGTVTVTTVIATSI